MTLYFDDINSGGMTEETDIDIINSVNSIYSDIQSNFNTHTWEDVIHYNVFCSDMDSPCGAPLTEGYDVVTEDNGVVITQEVRFISTNGICSTAYVNNNFDINILVLY